ncbi:MAG TPA: AAA family ATPase, partial [Candidatus Limnocylindrales bacterium]|nr:AAA family ATPase [Candidatus Limnocylindrales bacterium]
MLVEGAAGLGKSRLIAELSRRVEAGVGLVLHAKCYEIESEVPYAAVAEALAGALDDPALARLSPAWLAEAARLLPELRERFPDLPRPADGPGSLAAKRRLHQALVACLEALASERGVLVAVDDLHWADPPSLEVLHLLTQRLEESGILLALSYRPAELSPRARRFARAVLADRMARLVVLEPLTVDDVETLLTALGEFPGPGVGTEVARHLHRHSAGTPLFVSELLEALDRGGVLRRRDGTWRLTGADALDVLPATLGKLIADRVDRLEPWMRACLETMAVAGDEVPAEVLAGALRISEPRAEVALAALREERLVRPTATGGYEVLHDELRRLVYQGIPDGRRRVLHAAVGVALEAAGEERRPGGAARLAHHFDQAGDAERAHRYASAAAEEADAFAAVDARRAHLELATAHSPRALPPGIDIPDEADDEAVARGRKWAEDVRRARGRWLGAAAVLVIGVALVGLGERLFSSGGAETGDYRQGRLYLGDWSETSYNYELVWSDRAGVPGRIRELPEPPEGSPPRIVGQWVNERGETHAKLFRATKEGLEQITFGPSDDYPRAWSPDGRWLLFHRGWRTDDDRFQANLVLLDSLGNERARLTDTRYQDQWGDWSPTGTQIAVRRDSMGARTLWLLDADGARARDLTAEFRLPTTDFGTGFSPDGKRLAVAYPAVGGESGGIYVLDLTDGSRRTLPWAHEPRVGGWLLWSPDGRWLVYHVPRGAGHNLWVTAVDGSEGPHLLADLPEGVVARAWRGDADRHVARVELEPSVFDLRTGEGAAAVARAITLSGEPLDVELRWSVTDTAVARVDGRGFVVARRPGTVTLVATAGGLVADTAVVTVRLGAIDTVLVEDWRGGLDEGVWRPFGQPAPRVVPGVLPDGRPAFFAAGDYNHHSGVLSRTGFATGE